MIVCLCGGVSDGEVKSVIQRGVASLGELKRACGAGRDCGACCDALVCLLDEAGQSAQHEAEPSTASAGGGA